MKTTVTQNAIIDPSRRAFLVASGIGLAALGTAGAGPNAELGDLKSRIRIHFVGRRGD